MPLTAVSVTKPSTAFKDVSVLLAEAFPKEEQLPHRFMLWRTRHPDITLLAFYDGKTFVGFSFLITADRLTFVFYLAMHHKNRGKGYGAMALDSIRAHVPGNRVALTIEPPDPTADNPDQRIKRKAFYERNGFKASGRILVQRHQPFLLMQHGGPVQDQEVERVMRKVAGRLLYPIIRPVFHPAEDWKHPSM